MTDIIRTVELPVGSGKTFHMINEVNDIEGDVIFATPTVKLAKEVFHTFNQSGMRDKKTSVIVTSEHAETGQKVNDGIYSEIADYKKQINLVCTHAGLSCCRADILEGLKERKGSKLTVVIDELPSLFNSYYRRFSADLKAQLEGLIIIDDGHIEVIDKELYDQVLEYEFYHPDCIQLLRLMDTVRFKHDDRSDDWLFYGYELSEGLIDILRMADDVYIMASTITGSLDELILRDIYGFKFEEAHNIYDKIDTQLLVERAYRAQVIPLLDQPYSKAKALGYDYQARTGNCIEAMIDSAKELIVDQQSIIVTNNWALDIVRKRFKEVENVSLLHPNVKGLNTHQDKHCCLALYTAKPTPTVCMSLQLVSELYEIERSELLGAYSLQYDLDMITQMIGRTSIRDSSATEECLFIVPDRASAQHIVKVLTGGLDHYKNLVNESYMLSWEEISDRNTQIGRPLSPEKKYRLQQLEIQVLESENNGTRLPKNKDLATYYGVKPAQISKDLKVIRAKKVLEVK